MDVRYVEYYNGGTGQPLEIQEQQVDAYRFIQTTLGGCARSNGTYD
jgi:hypothetical protein